MMWRYVVRDKATGKVDQIDPKKVDMFFKVVEDTFCLTRPIAEAILHDGQKIENARVTVWAEAINPFSPARLF
jgi:hypothetical protein